MIVNKLMECLIKIGLDNLDFREVILFCVPLKKTDGGTNRITQTNNTNKRK